MIYLDRRVGSIELKPIFDSMKVACEVTTLDAGDMWFTGKGPNGECGVGIERKRVGDLANSIRTGRLSAVQIPGLIRNFEYAYLVVEGMFKPAPDGVLLIWSKAGWSPLELGGSRFMYSESFKALNTIQLMTPIKVLRSSSEYETALQVFHLYRWWNDKEWSRHSAHQAFHQDGHVEVFEPTYVRLFAKELPGIGWEKSKLVEKEFDTVDDMSWASREDWMRIDGIGEVLADRILRALHTAKARKGKIWQ